MYFGLGAEFGGCCLVISWMPSHQRVMSGGRRDDSSASGSWHVAERHGHAWGLVPEPFVIAPAGTQAWCWLAVLFLSVSPETLSAAESRSVPFVFKMLGRQNKPSKPHPISCSYYSCCFNKFSADPSNYVCDWALLPPPWPHQSTEAPGVLLHECLSTRQLDSNEPLWWSLGAAVQ